MQKIGEVAEEVGNLAAQQQAKLLAFGLIEGQAVMAMEEATAKLQAGTMNSDLYTQLAEYWRVHDRAANKRELLEALKTEAKNVMRLMEDSEDKKGWGGRAHGLGGNHGITKKLEAKAVAHLKDNKFTGKDAGGSWNDFFEDLMVVLGATDKDLEAAVREVTDIKNKSLNSFDKVKDEIDGDIWDRYSGELFARLLEITKDEALKLIRNEGLRAGRCGFWALRRLTERYNPRSYAKLLRLMLLALKPGEAKGIKNVDGNA